jgi:hypothetical protein
MSLHSARLREETSHVTPIPRTSINEAVKRHAEAIVRDKAIDVQSRALIRYALEINDPWLAELVRRADARESIVDTNGFLAMSISCGED